MFLFSGICHCLNFAKFRYTVVPLILHLSKSSTMDKLHHGQTARVFSLKKKNADLNKGVSGNLIARYKSCAASRDSILTES